MSVPRYPALYQINTRVWLSERSRELGRPATLDDIPDGELDQLGQWGFDWVWLLSVWQTGEAGRRVSLTNPEWRSEFTETLPDLCDDDICGSGFAITGYFVHADLGGDAALARFCERLRLRGLRLMLDFVPNHMGLDHPWVEDHPEFFVHGTDEDQQRAPQNYVHLDTSCGPLMLAHGRDPYFPGWPDTLQLNYANPDCQQAMFDELARIAGQCDGVRCDMAMLVLPEVFARTWGLTAEPFWPRAIERVRQRIPDFCFMAEVYWDLEWTLQQQGFNYAYDKRLYDRLRSGEARPVREHFLAGLDYQDRLARFLENHDEPRAAATFAADVHAAAAVLTYLSPGLRLFHQGQFTGATKRISPHLCRGPHEEINSQLQAFYQRLSSIVQLPVVRNGRWQLLECHPAWDGNGTWDAVVAFHWSNHSGHQLVVAVNYGPHQSQCRVPLPRETFADQNWRLRDLLSQEEYDRDGDEIVSRGIFLDLAPWQPVVFELTRRDR
jgi:glycosidase